MKHIIIAPDGGAPDALQAFVVPDTRAAIELAVEAFIQRLDEGDGDPDLEDSEAGETAITDRGRYFGEIEMGFSPSGEPSSHAARADESAEQASWAEWHTRGRRKDYGGAETPNLWNQGHEDVEDDDRDSCLAADDNPRRRFSDGLPGDRADTEPNGDEGDYSDGDCGHCGHYGVHQYGPTSERAAAETFAATDIFPRKEWPCIDPAELPSLYATTAFGTCLEPVFSDGVTLVFSKDERPEPGDFVVVIFRRGVLPLTEPQAWVKRLVSAGPEGFTFFDVTPDSALQPLVTVEMLNPPKRFTIPATKIAAIHKCLGEPVRVDGRCAVRKELLRGEARP